MNKESMIAMLETQKKAAEYSGNPVPYEYLIGIQEGRAQYDDFQKYSIITKEFIQDRMTTEADLMRMFQGSPLKEVFRGCRDFWSLRLKQLESKEMLLTRKA